MADRILILGASARAAAASARRAGMTPFAVDLFADADTERICEKVWRCPFDRYPDGLFELAKQAPPMPWMYTGGLENYPELVGELARERELWGNGPEVLRRVRDPRWLAGRDYPASLFYPRVVLPSDIPPESGEWVRKPLRGAGGLGVRPAGRDDLRGVADPDCGYFLHEFESGVPAAVALRDRKVIGLTRQLVGVTWLHAHDFLYSGSLTWDTELSDSDPFAWLPPPDGVWGADILAMPNLAALVEINPRYPASAEVIEFATGRPILVASDRAASRRRTVVGKAIYYAPCPITFPASGPWDDSLARTADVWHRPDFADLPHPGDVIEPGQPVLTILAEAATEADCLAQLQSRAADLDRLFGYTPEDNPCPP